jgi:hypothetical protein
MQLAEIHWGQNFLTEATAIPLLKMLGAANGTAPNITTLDLSQNLIAGIGATYAKLAKKLALQSFDLTNNPINDSDIIVLAEILITPVPNLKTIGEKKHLSRDLLRAIHSAHNQTALQAIHMANANISTQGALAFCRVAASAGLARGNFDLTGNDQIDANEINIDNCQISGASRLSPFGGTFNFFRSPSLGQGLRTAPDRPEQNPALLLMLGGMLPMIQTVVLLYVLYRLFKPFFEAPEKGPSAYSKNNLKM